MTSAADSQGPITSINVTPLVDILLVLLIIFIATAPLIRKRVVGVQVPKVSRSRAARTNALDIVYRQDKALFVSGRRLSPDGLERLLAQRLKVQPDLRVTLSADRRLGYGTVMSLLDAVKKSGVRRIGLEVERK